MLVDSDKVYEDDTLHKSPKYYLQLYKVTTYI